MVRDRNRAALKRLAAATAFSFALFISPANAMDFFLRTNPATLPQAVADIPLVVTNTSVASDTFVIWISGDGGWSMLEREIAARLAAEGVATVAINSFRYFDEPRSSQDIADALDRIAKSFSQEWGRHRIIFVGYSFGADTAPSAFLQSPDLRAQMQTAIFLSPSHHVYDEAGLQSWLGLGRGEENVQALRALDGLKLICVQGQSDEKAACAAAARPDMEHIILPSGHTLHGDGLRIADIILDHAHDDALAER